jgi:prephenate dehydratase
MSLSSDKSSTTTTKVAIQGYEGCFHQEAARKFFGSAVEVVPCPTFREVIRVSSSKKESDGGIMAIENSIAGSILPNYNLLQKSNLKIVGEVYLHIRQHLMVNPGITLTDIREVHSHPMALLQCTDFLDQHPWKLVETEDTALSAKYIHQHRMKHAAAIAGKLAAELYQMEIIAPNIHSIKNNYTRFLILKRAADANEIASANKSSLCFQTDHSRGSLARVLSIVADQGVNLSKLQSFPISGTDWKYAFHVDMEFDEIDQFYRVMDLIKPLTEGLNIYGVYQKGEPAVVSKNN